MENENRNENRNENTSENRNETKTLEQRVEEMGAIARPTINGKIVKRQGVRKSITDTKLNIKQNNSRSIIKRSQTSQLLTRSPPKPNLRPRGKMIQKSNGKPPPIPISNDTSKKMPQPIKTPIVNDKSHIVNIKTNISESETKNSNQISSTKSLMSI